MHFFVVPGGGPALLGTPDIENTWHLKCEMQHNRTMRINPGWLISRVQKISAIQT